MSSRALEWMRRGGRMGLSGFTSVLGALGGVARNKIFATFLDTTGVGQLAQILSGQNWLGTFTTGGLALPVSHAIATARGANDEPAVRRVVWTALVAVGSTALAVCALAILLAPALSTALLGSPEFAPLVRLSTLGVAGLSLQMILQGIYAGFSDVKATFTYALAGNLVATALVLALVPRFGLAGAVLGVASFFPVAILTSLFVHRRRYRAAFSPAPSPRFHGPTLRSMLQIAFASLLLALLDQGTLVSIRAHVVRAHGASANGLLQAAIGLAQQAGAPFYAYLGGYAFGRVSGLSGLEAVRDYTRRQWRLTTAVAALACGGGAVLAGPLLHVLYSDRFTGAAGPLAWTLVGEYSKIAMQAWVIGAISIGGVALWLPTGLVYTATMLVTYAVASAFGAGAYALPFAYAAAGFGGFAFTGVTLSRRGVTLAGRDLAWFAGTLAALVALALTRLR